VGVTLHFSSTIHNSFGYIRSVGEPPPTWLCSLQELVQDDERSIRRCIATPTLMVSLTSSGTRQDLLGLTLVLCAATVPLNFFQIQNIYAVVIEPHIITLSFSKTATWIENSDCCPNGRGILDLLGKKLTLL
jgi:hypothetical protein